MFWIFFFFLHKLIRRLLTCKCGIYMQHLLVWIRLWGFSKLSRFPSPGDRAIPKQPRQAGMKMNEWEIVSLSIVSTLSCMILLHTETEQAATSLTVYAMERDNSLPILGSPTQQNQLSVICVACHLSFFHSHLLASLCFFFLPLTTSTKHCHWTITDSAQMTFEIALFPLPCTHMSQMLFGSEWLHAKIKRDVPLAIELTARGFAFLPLFFLFFSIEGQSNAGRGVSDLL